ncbi:MAG: hypothetical protein WDM96_14090 [Lacunisphaera sp.]
MKNENRKYDGFVVPVPAHLNPKAKPDLYAFSGVDVLRGDTFAAVLRVLNVPGFISPAQFAADMAASGTPPRLSGTLTLFPPDYRLGEFTYCRPDGSAVTARASDTMEISPPQLTPPSLTPPQAPGKVKTAPPPPTDPGIDMSF